MTESLTDAELEEYRHTYTTYQSEMPGWAHAQRMLATIDALKASDNYYAKDAERAWGEATKATERAEAAEAKLDKVRELPERFESDHKFESHDGYNAGWNDGRARSAIELQAVLDS